jgi:Uma2 family endonuclease
MTVVEFLALPDDGVERDLIRGELRERFMTRRNRWHAKVEAKIAYLLHRWRAGLPQPRGEVYSGEVGCVLRRNPDSTVGIDVVYAAAEVASHASDETTMLDGPPILAVEILSPNDTIEQIGEKVDEYRAAGVALVWLVDPHFRTIMVHQQDKPPVLFNADQTIDGDPHLPGFHLAVREIFE